MELTNKTLALLLVAAIAVSLAGTIISLNKLNNVPTTGYATSTATSNVTITSLNSVRFNVASIYFGSGSVNSSAGYNNCTLFANLTAVGGWKSAGCINFAGSEPGPLIIENDGNVNLTNVQLVSSVAAAAFIGGIAVTPVYQYLVIQNETGSCATGLGPTTWTDVNTTGSGTSICTKMDWQDAADSIAVGVYIVIPADATGAKTSTWTVTGT
jgi:hypothetical protein